jgi:hypothetical protein
LIRPARLPAVALFVCLAFLPSAGDRDLTVEKRVAAQRAIEEVYWRHRIWPEANREPKPPLDEVMPESAIRAKVEDYLAKSLALEEYWSRAVTAEQLQAEMDRMARSTRRPEMLRALFAVLDNDPVLIAECLARPLLADRFIRNWYARDSRFHGDLRAEAEESLALFDSVEQMTLLGGEYRKIEVTAQSDEGSQPADLPLGDDPDKLELDTEAWQQLVRRLADAFVVFEEPQDPLSSSLRGEDVPARPPSLRDRLPVGRLSGLVEHTDHFAVHGLLDSTATGLNLATVKWPKQSFDAWWTDARRSLEEGSDSWQRWLTVGGEGEFDAAAALLTVPGITGAGCMANEDDVWYPSGTAWEPRSQHTAVWTEDEMIVWGGWDGSEYLNTGGRYDPVSKVWSDTAVGEDVPTVRRAHTAVWTGVYMVVWGGWDGTNSLNTGGRYDPSTNSWTPTSTINAPDARHSHTAVWLGGVGHGRLGRMGRYRQYEHRWTVQTVDGRLGADFNTGCPLAAALPHGRRKELRDDHMGRIWRCRQSEHRRAVRLGDEQLEPDLRC